MLIPGTGYSSGYRLFPVLEIARDHDKKNSLFVFLQDFANTNNRSHFTTKRSIFVFFAANTICFVVWGQGGNIPRDHLHFHGNFHASFHIFS